MEIPELENVLFEALVAPRISSESIQQGDRVDGDPPARMRAIGLDTNILKQLRRDQYRSDRILLGLETSGAKLVLPGQVVVEFWNNHHIFAKDDWKQLQTLLGKLEKQLDRLSKDTGQLGRIESIRSIIAEMDEELDESQTAEYLARSRSLMSELERVAIVPMVSRPRFAELAQVRFSSKSPPGFADQGKTSALGDFFVWCDFMLGILSLTEGDHGPFDVIWVTEDSKPDWKTGGRAHPRLAQEFFEVSGGSLHVTDLEGLEAALSATDAPSRESIES